MSDIINNSHFETQSYSYNEKQTPYLYSKRSTTMIQQQELPPTPSSSALSFLVTDQRSIDEDDEDNNRLPLNNSINTSPTNYGSLSTDFTYLRSASPTTSTISPNDDDEGLYLLWTHQLLRERGYQPSSCNANEEDDDNESMDSSITDLSVDPQQTSSSYSVRNSKRPSTIKSSSYTSSWLASCFPMC